MYSFITSDIDRRVYTPVDHQYDITDYGVNNLYPQIMGELYKRSPLTVQAIKVLSDFSNGEGWSGNGDKVVNRFGQTFNDLLRLASEDLNTFNGFSLHLNFSGIGRITEIQYLPFEYVRLGSKDLNGITTNVKVSNNWEQDSVKFNQYKGLEPTAYPLFNTKTAIRETLRGGNGQVLYWTPKMFSYPLCTFDSIRDAVQTDHEIQIWALKNIQNGFLGTNLVKIPGGFDSDEDKTQFINKIKDLQGSYNANSTIVADWPEDFTGSFIEPIPAANNDNLFSFTSSSTINKILYNFGIPGQLLAVNSEGALFTNQQLRDAYIYMNLRTDNQRKILTRTFDTVGKLFGVRLGEITTKPWEVPGMNEPKLNGDPKQLDKEEKKEEEPKEEETETEARLIKLYG